VCGLGKLGASRFLKKGQMAAQSKTCVFASLMQLYLCFVVEPLFLYRTSLFEAATFAALAVDHIAVGIGGVG
jgi:hypothetical protein